MDLKMISADDHIDLGFLPRDLWLERLPSKLKDRAPHVEDRGDLGDYWVCEEQPWGDWRGGAWFSRKRRALMALDRGGVGIDYTMRPTTTAQRLEDMDRDGVEAQVMFPPIFGMIFSDRELKIACIQAYNDWAVEFAQTAPERLLAIAQLFPDDAEASTEEVKRVAKLGIKEVNFLVGTVTTEMYQEGWDKFWDAAEEAGVIVSYHVGGGSRGVGGAANRQQPESEGRKPSFSMGLGDGSTTFFQPFVNLFSYGTLERHPKLKFKLAESGTGWIPFVVQEMDYRYERSLELVQLGRGPEIPLKERPSTIFKRQVYATYQQDAVGLHLVEFFGDGHMMWASDYPHGDSTWPFSQEVVARETAHLSPEMRQKIVRENAKALYGL